MVASHAVAGRGGGDAVEERTDDRPEAHHHSCTPSLTDPLDACDLQLRSTRTALSSLTAASRVQAVSRQ